MSEAGTASQAALMDGIYRGQRHIYDLTRKYYLFGRDGLIEQLAAPDGATVIEIACGTGRNLGAIKRKFTGKDKKGKRKGSTQPAIRAAFGGKQLRRPGRRDEGSDSSEEREESEEDGNSEEKLEYL